MSIRCGHCEGRHETVAQVRQCQAFEAHKPTTRPAEPDWMRTDAPPAIRASRATVTQDGMYIKPDGRIFKVQWNRASGDGRRIYAKQLVVRVLEGGRVHQQMYGLLDVLEGSVSKLADMDFVYASGAILMLRPEERMTMEQAARFGKLYGRCVRCGKVLTLEESIERAMGRVCAGKL